VDRVRRLHVLPPPPSTDRAIDPESQAWLDSLGDRGSSREQAIARLHALLLKASRFEAARRRASVPELTQRELEDIAMQSANDALVAVLAKLDTFEGRSRFTTWAYKFALLETAVKLRRRPWQSHEVSLDEERWTHVGPHDEGPAPAVELAELLAAIRAAMHTELSEHQRKVLVAVALNGVPIDVLAERLGTTRGALYKTVHDARAKLRRKLRADGHVVAAASEGDIR
jgi:RNA polymerase sigma-70 factor (ECF subfamily)